MLFQLKIAIKNKKQKNACHLEISAETEIDQILRQAMAHQLHFVKLIAPNNKRELKIKNTKRLGL